MKYILIAKCDVCGKSVVYESDEEYSQWPSSETPSIFTIAQKAGMLYLEKRGKMVCQDCHDEYNKIRQRCRIEIENFLKIEKEE